MPVVNAIDSRYATCKVMSCGEWVKGRYKWTRQSDGFHIVEVRTDHGMKTRKAFSPDDTELFEDTKVVLR